jgi:hypothetical protein
MRELVAGIQGGAFCRMCGIREVPLHVDHIEPASLHGSDEVANLQLLCAECNLGKSGTTYGRLAAALVASVATVARPSLRYLRLSLSSITEAGRPLGQCDCGRTAMQGQLTVFTSADSTANLLNLRISCDACEGST